MNKLYKIFIPVFTSLFFNVAVGNQQLVLDNLKQLVSFQTVSNNNEEILLAYDWIVEQIADLPVYHKMEFYNGYPSLLITTQDTKTPYVWLVAHMDVVSAAAEMFNAKVDGDKLIGRGVLDMKIAIAVGLTLLQEMGDDLVNYNFGLMITADEEIGGENGVKALLADGYSSEIVFIPDGGFDWEVEEQAKGGVVYEVVAEGVAAHGSRPWLGKNAIWNLVSFLEDVEQLFIELKHDDEYFATVNLGTIEGGVATNQVPDMAKAKLDVRYPSAIPFELIDDRMNELADFHQGITLVRGNPRPAIFNDSNHPDIQQFKRIAKQLYNIDVGIMRAHGGSDAKYFWEVGIPALIILPTGGDIHSVNEWIDIDDIGRFYDVSQQWIKTIAANE